MPDAHTEDECAYARLRGRLTGCTSWVADWMHVVGLEVEWVVKYRTGIAVLDPNGALQHIGSAIGDDEIR